VRGVEARGGTTRLRGPGGAATMRAVRLLSSRSAAARRPRGTGSGGPVIGANRRSGVAQLFQREPVS